MTTDNSKQRIIAIASVIIIALLAVNAYLLINNINKGKELESQSVELEASEQLVDSLENQYNQAMLDLDQLKGVNTELNAMIDQQKAELTEQKNRITGLIRNKKDLARAREEIKDLSAKVEGYIVEINRLKDENAELAEAKSNLEQSLSQQKIQNQELSSAKAALVSDKKQLESERAVLSEKVNYASVVRLDELEVTGYKERGSGKLVKKRYAKNVEQLEICFNTEVNEVAEAGLEKFYVRLISPVGETIGGNELGSGTIKSKEAGGDVLYTQLVEHEYNNDDKRVCVWWKPSVPFQEGTYKIEVYNKGFIAGQGDFRLK